MAGPISNRTVGVSPKVAIPTSVLIAAGAILAILDQLGIFEVDDTLWQVLFAAGGVTGATGVAASPGDVQPAANPADEARDIHEVA